MVSLSVNGEMTNEWIAKNWLLGTKITQRKTLPPVDRSSDESQVYLRLVGLTEETIRTAGIDLNYVTAVCRRSYNFRLRLLRPNEQPLRSLDDDKRTLGRSLVSRVWPISVIMTRPFFLQRHFLSIKVRSIEESASKDIALKFTRENPDDGNTYVRSWYLYFFVKRESWACIAMKIARKIKTNIAKIVKSHFNPGIYYLI